MTRMLPLEVSHEIYSSSLGPVTSHSNFASLWHPPKETLFLSEKHCWPGALLLHGIQKGKNDEMFL